MANWQQVTTIWEKDLPNFLLTIRKVRTRNYITVDGHTLYPNQFYWEIFVYDKIHNKIIDGGKKRYQGEAAAAALKVCTEQSSL